LKSSFSDTIGVGRGLAGEWGGVVGEWEAGVFGEFGE
jgi:hypothetical protein